MYQHLFTDGARLAEIDIWMFTKAFGNDERLIIGTSSLDRTHSSTFHIEISEEIEVVSKVSSFCMQYW